VIRPIALLLAALALAASEWSPARWRDESAWAASAGAWTATVSVERGRLVSLRHRDGGELLHVDGRPLAELRSTRGVLGGHISWLGPQRDWWWPPLAEWEGDPPVTVDEADGWLEIRLAAGTDAFPPLVRRYRWRDGALLAVLAWSGQGHYAMHIVQVPLTATVTLADDSARTYGLPDDLYTPLAKPIDHAGIELQADGRVRVFPAATSRKHMVPPRPILSCLPWGGTLLLEAGATTGVIDGLPDRGLLTQIFTDPAATYIEIEQMSPLLAGEASAEVRLIPGLAP